jgi:hypothetical protein
MRSVSDRPRELRIASRRHDGDEVVVAYEMPVSASIRTRPTSSSLDAAAPMRAA